MKARAVVVAHHEPMVAEGIAAALASYPWIVPVGVVTSASGVEAYADRAEAAVVDAALPGSRRAAATLRRSGVRVVMLGDGEGTSQDEDEPGHVSTMQRVAALAHALVPSAPLAPRRATSLTPRQREVLDLIAGGLAGKQVARQLGISPKTVERHKTQIFARLGVANQAAAVSVMTKEGSGTWSHATT